MTEGGSQNVQGRKEKRRGDPKITAQTTEE
jgi:hypothetical protein